MPVIRLQIKPGVNVERTPTLNEGGIAGSNLIRFMDGLPQKMGGWKAINYTPFIGTCRGLLGWGDLNGNAWLAAGTEQKLYVFNDGVLYDITPIRYTSNNAPSLSVTANSTYVTVTDTNNGVDQGDWVQFNCHVSIGGIVLFGQYYVTSVSNANTYTIQIPTAPSSSSTSPVLPTYSTTSGTGVVTVTLPNHGLSVNSSWEQVVPVTVGGITIQGPYLVSAVLSSSQFQITAGSAATSSATATENGGNLQIQYYWPSGVAVNTLLSGWGVGPYGEGAYGTANAGGAVEILRQWSLTHFGQDLIANYPNGPIFLWSPATSTQNATILQGAPSQARLVFMMNQAEILVACGTPLNGVMQPTLISWCDAGNFNDWTPSPYNQAGNFQLPNGSKIVAATAFGLGALIWTDEGLWSMTYQGLPYVFGFNQIGVACEAISMRSVAPVPGELVVWPNLRGFYSYNGYYVTPMKCPVWDFFFYQVDYNQLEQIFCAINTLFNEVAWFFPVANPSSPDQSIGYVKWNFLENLWDVGYLDRTAWIDESPMGNPIGADTKGLFMQHEVGNDANGQPINWYWETGYYDLAQGDHFSFVDFVMPDWLGNYSQIQMQIKAVNNPNFEPWVHGPYTLTPTTPYVNTRVRGRQFSFVFSGNDMGSFVRLGQFRVRMAPAGRR